MRHTAEVSVNGRCGTARCPSRDARPRPAPASTASCLVPSHRWPAGCVTAVAADSVDAEGAFASPEWAPWW